MLQRGCAEPQDETQDQGEDEEFVEASPAPGGGTQGHIPCRGYMFSLLTLYQLSLPDTQLPRTAQGGFCSLQPLSR